jgi:hypothetical protein
MLEHRRIGRLRQGQHGITPAARRRVWEVGNDGGVSFDEEPAESEKGDRRSRENITGPAQGIGRWTG